MIVLAIARKPLSGPTISANALVHGTGGLNIDGCRIPCGWNPTIDRRELDRHREWSSQSGLNGIYGTDCRRGYSELHPADSLGRWPANVILAPTAATVMATQGPALQLASKPADYGPSGAVTAVYSFWRQRKSGAHPSRNGGADTFFLTVPDPTTGGNQK